MKENDNKGNIVEMPKGNEDEAEKSAPQMTPEEIEAKQKEAEEAAEKSRLVHLEALRMNPFVLRDTFQRQIIDAMVSESNKVKVLCEAYEKWSAIMANHATNMIDTSEVTDQTKSIIDRYVKTIRNNSLVGGALFQRSIQGYVIAVDEKKVAALIDALGSWNDAEMMAGQYT